MVPRRREARDERDESREGPADTEGPPTFSQPHPPMRPKVFINTRFNMVMKGGAEHTDKNGMPTRTDAWLARRFDLFERYCLPSLMAQTDQEFLWFVFFSHRTPQPFMDRIRGIQERFPPFVPCFLQDFEQQGARYRSEVEQRLGPEDAFVITGRIDNDDAFHRTFVERLRKEFRSSDDEYVNFTRGLQLDAERGVLVDVRRPSNAFVVRMERVRNGSVGTVLEVMHHHAQDTGLLRNVEAEPLWLQLIHGANMENGLRSARVRFGVDLRAEFGIVDPPPIRWWPSLLVGAKHWAVDVPMGLARRAARIVLKRGS